MKIRAGFEIAYDCPQPTPMILQVSVHPSRQADLITWDGIKIDPPIPANTYHDTFGNFCHVIRAPAGRLILSTDFLAQDSGEPTRSCPMPWQHPLEELPVDALIFLLGSRYCETDRLSDFAWSTVRPPADRLAAGPGDLRLRARAHQVRLRAREPDQDGLRCLHGGARRVPRLRASRHHAVPLHEHSGALLHRLSRRHGHGAALSAREISRPGSRPISAGAGTSSIRATTCRASAAS